MKASRSEIFELASNLNNWHPLVEVPNITNHKFTESQIRYLNSNRKKSSSLTLCFKRMGKRAYCNPSLLSLHMAGLLPVDEN